ncbi:NAD(P)/FAD-dependent oxidoreductase [Levilactobacillus tujiorum]|uniref:Ferredoxin--NADP reductase n=1 Tax=Levilactobacillus tujiorum TaxID=2912243 RepID=A0ABX1L7T6_9LACO|nr:NAD(P)/FAD-dependent oxidoreductase [Levilactobacillus tujiorum]MCH5465393.1 NAD(P)/FAD-dependent oxidoreductase [Levilactobacillus tujiorum]NLR12360.1 NAD(P)/FAD-dependent oxidoreductase [Lactobacillus sp. HBUAS51387]NLR30396.1 NAD(P)/FAD-dependent oxidoreductase [Levilactobacillus tujiorum]
MTESYDITIIGGGPVGMFAAFYAGMHNAKTQVIESLAELGGQVNALYPEKTILDVAGFPGVKGRDLIAGQRQQLEQFPLTIKTGEAVTNVTPNDAGFTVTTPKGSTQTRAVIVAVGNGAFAPRHLNVENETALAGQHLFYSVRDLESFRGHRVMVAGGGDAAIDQALMLEPVAKSVTLLHRRAQFRGLAHMVDLLQASTVNVQTPYLIRGLEETAAGEVDVTLKQVGATAATTHQVVDDLIVSYGFTADHSALAAWDISMAEDHRLIAVDRQMMTSVPGVYAIGDGATYPGKSPLIAIGYGEAPVAVQAIMSTYFPERRGPVHSTSITLKP